MRNLTVLFVLSLIFFSFATDIPLASSLAPVTTEEKQKVIELLSTDSGYVIDDVLALIEQLLGDTQGQLTEVEDSWGVTYQEKTETIRNITLIIQDLQPVCQSDLEIAEEYNETILNLRTKIQEYEDIIAKNINRSQILHDARCQANQNYILGLTKSKKTLALITILREAVQQFSEQSLVQLGFKKLGTISQILSQMARKSGRFLTLLQGLVPNVPDVTERTTEEIGTGYADNDQNQITVSSFDSQTIENLQGVKTKLLNLLDTLEETIKAEMVTSQVNELASNVNLADFELSLENENLYYKRIMKNLTINLNETLDAYIVALGEVEQCQIQLNSWRRTLEAAETDLQNSTDYYNTKKEELGEMIDLFTEIYNLYKNEVSSVTEEYKQRADDYIVDQTFNTTEDFDARTADEYYNITGSVENTVYDEASQNVGLIQLRSKVEDEKMAVLERTQSLIGKIRTLNRYNRN